jgi:UrcA family protein
MIRSALIASTLGLMLVGTSALAQSYEGPGQGEDIIVQGPLLHIERPSWPGQVPSKISMSIPVRYDDLDLRSQRDARELRGRVREAAADVCDRLKDFYPDTADTATDCYREASRVAIEHADRAIDRARYTERYDVAYYP